MVPRHGLVHRIKTSSGGEDAKRAIILMALFFVIKIKLLNKKADQWSAFSFQGPGIREAGCSSRPH